MNFVNPADKLLNNGDEVGDEHPGTVYGIATFVFVDFQYLETDSNWGGPSYGHSGLILKFINKHPDLIKRWRSQGIKPVVIEGYYYPDKIALMSDNTKFDLAGGDKNNNAFDNKNDNTEDEEDNFLSLKDVEDPFSANFTAATNRDREKGASLLASKLNVQKVYALHMPKFNVMKRLASLVIKKK